jgi:sterol desaturase/sphingolipid hydroxylase (fatty acid hydroxylase superfamily)
MTIMSPSLEIAVRVSCYAVVFAAMALWEWWAPRRRLGAGRRSRWPGNLGILAVGVALIAGAHGWGLLRLLALPAWAAIPLGVVALDLVIYAQHVVFHHVPVLWRVHRMHHADVDIDVTTGVRFHPIEILLSLAIKIAAVAALGVPAVAVLIFEVLLNATSMFNHSNVALPPRLDRLARWIVVTPQMHQVHHSIRREEADSNFGFNLSWWDRLFGTYRATPAAGEAGMTIGLSEFRSPRELRLDCLLTQPFRREGNRQA